MGAAEMQILGIVLIAVGVVVIAAQILLSFWLKKVRREANMQEDGR